MNMWLSPADRSLMSTELAAWRLLLLVVRAIKFTGSCSVDSLVVTSQTACVTFTS